MAQTKASKKLKRNMVTPNHDKYCQYWAGCNPFTGEEGCCDCGLGQITSEPELHMISEETPKSKIEPKRRYAK